MTLVPRKIEDRVNFYLWTAPKLELLVSPTWPSSDDKIPFENSLQRYLEESPYGKIIYTEFLLTDPSVLVKNGSDKTRDEIRNICLQTMSQLNTGCRFSIKLPNALSLEENISLSRSWGDLIIGFCLDFETCQSNSLVVQLQAAHVPIKAVIIQTKQLAKLSKDKFPALPTHRLLLQDMTAVSEQELEYIFSELLPDDSQLCLSIRPDQLEQIGKKLHLLFSRGICFYLSRATTDTESPLSDMIRSLPIDLRQADRLINDGYKMASISVYEESRFLDMLRLTQQRYAVHTPPKRVAIFGKRSTNPEEKAYQLSQQIAAGLAAKGFQVMTGGYVGIMEAANKGALEGEKMHGNAAEPLSEGILCPTLFYSRIKGNESLTKRYVCHGINQRTDKLVEDSSILIAMPGTVGTMTELLVGLGMSTIDHLYSLPGYPRPIIALRHPWQELVENAWGLMNAPRNQIDEYIEYFDSATEAIELVQKKYELLLKATHH